MSDARPVLVTGPTANFAGLRTAIREIGGRVVESLGAADAASALEHERPELWLVAPEAMSFELRSLIDRERDGCAVLGSGAPGSVTPDGFDALVPADATAAAPALRLALALGRARRERRELARQADRAQQAAHMASGRLGDALLALLERQHPGARERGDQLTRLAMQVAHRFEIAPVHLDGLELAARVREAGRLALPQDPAVGDPAWEWSVTRAIAEILDGMPEFADAADVLAGMHENWDGTGHPGHLLAGQIPMRSRILRAAYDYLADMAMPGARSLLILEHMSALVGTCYDPLVVVHLRAVIEGGPQAGTDPSRAQIPVTGLTEGMVLAEDLFAENGMKLLARGTVLTKAALQVILRRHAQEPMYAGISIRRGSRG